MLERAEVVDELLQRENIANEALFHLVAGGYLIEWKTLKRAWIAHLERRQRQIERLAKRRRGGMEGLVPARPTPTMLASYQGEFDGLPLAQALLELHRKHINTNERIGPDDAYVLIADIADSFHLSPREEQVEEVAKLITEPLENLLDRAFEADWVRKSDKHQLIRTQVLLSRTCRIIRNIVERLGISVEQTAEMITVTAVLFGPTLLKLALVIAEFDDERKALWAARKLEVWSLTVEPPASHENGDAPKLSRRTLARLRRVCREIFGTEMVPVHP